jgi:hypothetical protein
MSLSIKPHFADDEIFDSGAIVIRDLSPLTLTLTSSELTELYDIVIHFVHIEGGNGRIDWTVPIPNKKIEVTLTNFDSPYGLTLHNPIPIGLFKDKPLLLDIIIYTLGNDPKTKPPKLFCYTLRAGAANS